MVGEMVGSYWLALIFQTSHVISEVGVVIMTNVFTRGRHGYCYFFF